MHVVARFAGRGLLLVLLLVPWAVRAAGDEGEKPAAAEEVAFPLQEFSVLEEPDNACLSLLRRGQAVFCQDKPFAQVQKYPPLRSSHPWYGEAVFGRQADQPGSGQTFYFVLDESAPPPAPASNAEGASILEKIAEALSGQEKNAEKSPATAPTYDRLYFDLNGNLDLTDDAVLEPLPNPPAGALLSWSAQQKVVFGELTIPLEGAPEDGPQPVRLLPRLLVNLREGTPSALLLFMAVTARQGTVRIGPHEYTAVLGHPYMVSGRFDTPSTNLQLTSTEAPTAQAYWWGHDTLRALHWSEGRFYQTRATPRGDTLFVRPYGGDMGTFRISAGPRTLDHVGVSGSLRSETTAVPLGELPGKNGWPGEVQECQVPVGDYLPTALHINFGHLRIFISENYHADGQPRATSGREWVYGIKIRKDEPFVLDFSHKPEVLFANPAKDQTFHPGDEIQVKAVLIDPVLDIMIRNLDDTSRKKKETRQDGDRELTSERTLSLDPTVTITNAAGKIVAEGTLPFG